MIVTVTLSVHVCFPVLSLPFTVKNFRYKFKKIALNTFLQVKEVP